MKTAHYFKARFNVQYVVFGTDGRHDVTAQKHEVKNKREANKLAEEEGAKPWNF